MSDDVPLFPCPEVSRGLTVLRCTKPLGHDMAHEHVDDHGRWLSSWVTPEEFAAARARGEFDHPDYCRCDEPVPVCDDCGGEIL